MKRTRRQHGVFAMADDGSAGSNGGGQTVAGAVGSVVGQGGAAGSTATSAAGAGDAAGSTAGASTGAASLLPSGTSSATGTEWLSEKYQVKKDDGSIDIEASARKVAEAHTALEGRMRVTGLPPATAEEYVPEGLPDGFTFDEVKADPMYQDFATKAHAAGLTNAQLGLVLSEWHARSGEVAGEAAGLTVEAAKAELETAWGADQFGTKIQAASGAINVVAAKAGITVEQINEAGLGRNPTFLRLMESISAEFKPDGTTPDGLAPSAQDFDTRLAELRADPAYADDKHPDHGKVMAKKAALYEARYPAKKT